LKKIILCYLSPEELFEFSQIDDFEVYQGLAAEAYKDTYGNIAVYAKGTTLINSDGKDLTNIINIRGIAKLAVFLKTFNKNVKNIRIDFGTFDQNEISQLLDIIVENCAETLTRFEIRNIYQGELQAIQKISFPNLEEVSFFNCFSEMETIDLTKTFPKLRRLSAFFIRFTDRTWIQDNFVNLTHVNLDIGEILFTEEDVMDILNANPLVHSLGLNHYTPSLLRTINSNFTNVVNLGLMNIPFAFRHIFEPIHMEHIEKCFYKGTNKYRHHISTFINFERLIELTWNSGDNRPERIFLKLIDENKNTIEKLEIVDTIISDGNLAKMFNMKKLKKALFTLNSKRILLFSVDTFLDFIKSNEELEEVRLIGAKRNFYRKLVEKLKSSGILGWMEVFNRYSKGKGDIRFVKKQFGAGKWENEQQFFDKNLF